MCAAKLTRALAGVLILAGLAGLAGCGVADALTGSKNGLSQDEVNAFMQQVGTAYSNGMSSAHPQLAPTSLLRAGNIVFPLDSPPQPWPVLVNVSVQQRTNCTAGGNISVSGSMTGSLDNNGSGVLSTQVTETISDWQCITGIVINGDPYMSAVGTFSFLNGQQSTAAQISFGGGFKWTGNNTGSCQIQMTMLFYPNGTAHLSGSACGRSVDESI